MDARNAMNTKHQLAAARKRTPTRLRSLLVAASLALAVGAGWLAASVKAQEPSADTALLTSILQQLLRIEEKLGCLCGSEVDPWE